MATLGASKFLRVIILNLKFYTRSNHQSGTGENTFSSMKCSNKQISHAPF